MIQLKDLEKCYKAGSSLNYVLRDITLNVQQGEFVTIMGPSGAGKSTLLSILGLLDADFGGEYRLLDQIVNKLKPKERAKLGRENIGFVFQQYHLLDHLTVEENLAVPLSYRDVKASEIAAIVADTLDRFNIVGKKKLYPSQLSGGQQQLVGVARAVIAEPKLILADEPTGNLHSRQGCEVMELFKRLNNEGATIIQVTHSEENARYSQRVIQLHDGWVTADKRTAAPAA